MSPIPIPDVNNTRYIHSVLASVTSTSIVKEVHLLDWSQSISSKVLVSSKVIAAFSQSVIDAELSRLDQMEGNLGKLQLRKKQPDSRNSLERAAFTVTPTVLSNRALTKSTTANFYRGVGNIGSVEEARDLERWKGKEVGILNLERDRKFYERFKLKLQAKDSVDYLAHEHNGEVGGEGEVQSERMKRHQRESGAVFGIINQSQAKFYMNIVEIRIICLRNQVELLETLAKTPMYSLDQLGSSSVEFGPPRRPPPESDPTTSDLQPSLQPRRSLGLDPLHLLFSRTRPGIRENSSFIVGSSVSSRLLPSRPLLYLLSPLPPCAWVTNGANGDKEGRGQRGSREVHRSIAYRRNSFSACIAFGASRTR
ncbi:hypothetical protein F5878DRAFT_642089 [Lentinula raphanica]|uniref:Uncharacterized protein n=1 Tax=Lentinula raphanica TaxID=153919 RepID=A0AA38UDZ3_9AGAR|nr:hypothetical protein F5878DRAFT_642089 [Lentinula raphanica]